MSTPTHALDNNYRHAMVTYLDILGFRKLIHDSRSDAAQVNRILTLLKNLKQKVSEGGRVHRNEQGEVEKIFQAFNFSDLTVRCTEIPDGATLGDYLNWEMMYVADLQLSLLREHVLIRGGICAGDILIRHDLGIVFGPALVKAYKIESEQAVFPRIIIDYEFLHTIDESTGERYWRDYVRRGEDGAYFLDYLFGAVLVAHEYPEDVEAPDTLLEAHQRTIVSAISDDIRKKDARIRQKYLWLALYHNSTLGRLKERFKVSRRSLETDRFSIPENLLDF